MQKMLSTLRPFLANIMRKEEPVRDSKRQFLLEVRLAPITGLRGNQLDGTLSTLHRMRAS